MSTVASGTKRRATYQDVIGAPKDKTAEILNGELVLSPRPANPHSFTMSTLMLDVGSPFFRGIGGPGGWIILIEPELHPHDDVVVPDLAGWRRERMPETPNGPFIELPPDWVCEILSPSTQSYDRIVKLEIYRREGVKHLWFVDPVAGFVEVYRLQDQGWVRSAAAQADQKVRLEPFDAVELNVSAWWARAPTAD